jgi:hypothetical protein
MKFILRLMAIRVWRIGYFVSKINTDGSFGKVQNVGMEANSLRMILDIGLTPNPEEAFSPQTEQVDKDMMIFINSWKLKLLCEQELYGKVTDLVTSEILQGKISLFDNKFNPIGTVNTDAKGNYTFLWNAENL